MKSLVAVYASHDDAINAVEGLKKGGYDTSKISLISKADIVKNHVYVKASNTVAKAEMSVGLVGGAILGILTGVGVFAIPGFGFLFGAGALVGIFGGVDLGIIVGGIVTILTGLGIDEANSLKYERHLNEGKFLVFVQGSPQQIEDAQKIVHTHGLHLELSAY